MAVVSGRKLIGIAHCLFHTSTWARRHLTMPSEPQQGDIVPIVVFSLLFSFLATIYPSWNASRLQPAEALRYE